jgi:hypothetical protein
MEKGNLHNHAMVRECAGWTVDNLEHAITIAAATLPDGKGTARELPVHPNAFRVSYEQNCERGECGGSCPGCREVVDEPVAA